MLFDAKQFVQQEQDYQQSWTYTSAFFLGAQTVEHGANNGKIMGLIPRECMKMFKCFAVCNVVLDKSGKSWKSDFKWQSTTVVQSWKFL